MFDQSDDVGVTDTDLGYACDTVNSQLATYMLKPNGSLTAARGISPHQAGPTAISDSGTGRVAIAWAYAPINCGDPTASGSDIQVRTISLAAGRNPYPNAVVPYLSRIRLTPTMRELLAFPLRAIGPPRIDEFPIARVVNRLLHGLDAKRGDHTLAEINPVPNLMGNCLRELPPAQRLRRHLQPIPSVVLFDVQPELAHTPKLALGSRRQRRPIPSEPALREIHRVHKHDRPAIATEPIAPPDQSPRRFQNRLLAGLLMENNQPDAVDVPCREIVQSAYDIARNA